MTVTLHFQSSGTMPGNAEPFAMLGGSITIGRGDVNDLVLPDPDKVISTRHCAIEDQNGNLVVIDFSTNGTFLNYGKMALGQTPTPLNNGDILSIGSYELLVEVPQAAAAPLADPVPHAQVSPGVADTLDDLADPLAGTSGKDDFLDGLLGSQMSGPSAVQRDELGADGLMPPLDEEEDFLSGPVAEQAGTQSVHGSSLSDIIQTPRPATSEIPDDWDIDLELPSEPMKADPVKAGDLRAGDENAGDVKAGEDVFAAEPQPARQSEPQSELQSARQSVPDPSATAPETPPAPQSAAPVANPVANPGDTAAARAFLETLGAGHLGITDAELPETMARLGDVMNTFVSGVRAILMTRQSIKSEFRINQTVISAGANNPLKFSVSVDQAIEAMTRPATKGYLPAAEAAREAMDDISAHEVAMMTGMEAALKGVLAELEPARLAQRISKDKSLTSVLSNRKARYWDVFEAQYEKISDQAENDFHDLFSKAFAKAYQDQLERLKG